MEILTNVNRKKFEYKNWKGGNEILLEACIIIHWENYLKTIDLEVDEGRMKW